MCTLIPAAVALDIGKWTVTNYFWQYILYYIYTQPAQILHWLLYPPHFCLRLESENKFLPIETNMIAVINKSPKIVCAINKPVFPVAFHEIVIKTICSYFMYYVVINSSRAFGRYASSWLLGFSDLLDSFLLGLGIQYSHNNLNVWAMVNEVIYSSFLK